MMASCFASLAALRESLILYGCIKIENGRRVFIVGFQPKYASSWDLICRSVKELMDKACW